MMAVWMVTCGRGLDNFVWQEILQKIPDASNLRHLGEGKIAFNVCQAVRTIKTVTPLSRKNVSEVKDAVQGILNEEDDTRETRGELGDTSESLKEIKDTKGTLKEQNTTTKEFMVALGTHMEEENQWVAAVSYIFKLKLVERVFTLLHCEDIDSGAAPQDTGGNSSTDDILRDYKNKLTSLVGNIKWDDLTVRMRRVREHQGGERQLWCQDPDSCPGSLRKRQAKEELGEKRMASASSRGAVRSFPKHHRTDSIKGEHYKKRETRVQGSKRKKLTDDHEFKPSMESYNVCEHENSKMQGISKSSIEQSNYAHLEKEYELENAFNNNRQNSQSFHIDAKPNVTAICDHVTGVGQNLPSAVISSEYGTYQLDKACVSWKETNICEDEVAMPSETKVATNMVDIISENCTLLQNKLLNKNYCQPSSPEFKSKEVKRENQDLKVNSTEHVSTFRVSSRVSGPHKNILSVKWVNQALGQQLSKAMAAWVPDWRQPLIDLYVNITATHFIVGAALSPRPLSLRPYIPHLTLRSTTSHLMARLSQMPHEATVLDPMCGGGSILLEAAMSFDISHVIASDSSREQLEVARCNLHNLRVPVTLLEADAERLPLQDSSINTVLCDFPFGQKYKLTVECEQLLAGVLKEMQRLLVCGGRAVFLLSPRQHQALSQLTWDKTKTSIPTNSTGDCLTLLETHLVSLGETSAYVAVTCKEHPFSEVFTEKKKGVSVMAQCL